MRLMTQIKVPEQRIDEDHPQSCHFSRMYDPDLVANSMIDSRRGGDFPEIVLERGLYHGYERPRVTEAWQ